MRILVLGYSPRLSGGVVNVTQHLLDHLPNLELHPILFCYGKPIKSVLFTLSSFFHFLLKISFFRKRYKIVHIIIGSSGDAVRTIPFILLAKILRLKICLQFHKSSDILKKQIPNKLLLSLVVKAWQMSHVLAFLSPKLKTLHEAEIGSTSPTAIIPNALPPKWLVKEAQPFSERTKDIIFLGRWSWEKGIDDLTAAMATLDIDTYCDIYSDAPKEENHKKCRFHPWATSEQVKHIISSAKLLVLPSYSEAYPTILLEAAACGTPFIATDIAGVPDIVENSKAGLLITPGDNQDLNKKIKEILLDRVLWNQLSLSGIQWAKEQTIETITQQWDRLYKSL